MTVTDETTTTTATQDGAEPPKQEPPQRPSMGRVVLFAIPDDEGKFSGRRCPAVVTTAWDEECVNLSLLPDASFVELVHQTSGMLPTSVHFDDSNPPAGRTWSWPPRV